ALADGVDGKWVNEPKVEVPNLRAFRPKAIERVEQGPLRRTPGDDHRAGVLRAEVGHLHVVGDLAGGQVQLREPLLHHRVPQAGVLGDVPQLVVYVPGVPEDRLFLSEKRARGNGTVLEAESLVRILFRIAVVAEGQGPALDPKVGEVR